MDALEFSIKPTPCIFGSNIDEIVGRIPSSVGIRTADVPFLKIVKQTVAAANFSALYFLNNDARDRRAVAIVNCAERCLVEGASALI